MKRREWTFTYVATEIASAAARKSEHHRAREDWWTQERAKADLLVQDSAEVRAVPQTGGDRPEVVIDPTASARWSECDRKIKEHREKAAGYEVFVSVMGDQDDSEAYELDAEDVLYFGLV